MCRCSAAYSREKTREHEEGKIDQFLKQVSEEKQHTVSEISEGNVGEQEVDMDEVDHRVEDEELLDPALVEAERREECGPWQEATTTSRDNPTTMKWVDCVKKDEGHQFV